MCLFITLFYVINLNSLVISDDEIKNKIRFPYGNPILPYIGLFVGLAMPLDLQNIDLFFSANLEAAYTLPTNQTNFTYPPDISSRSVVPITRWDFYKVLENKLQRRGYPGKSCLLRMICETTEKYLDYNGLLGDLISVALRPSLSKTENNMTVYDKAERYGEIKKHCKKYNKTCSISVLELITWF